MTKITKKDLLQIIKEEYSNVLKKKELTEKLKSINEEISQLTGSLEEVHAGEEMHGGDHEGQATPEFEKKGSAIVETPTVDEGLEKNVHLSGDEIKFMDQKIGKLNGDKVEFDPAYVKYFNPEVIDAVIKAQSAEAAAMAANNSATSLTNEEAEVTQECDMPHEDGGEEFEEVIVGSNEESEESSSEEGSEGKDWIFERQFKKITPDSRRANINEGIGRMLKLSGLKSSEE